MAAVIGLTRSIVSTCIYHRSNARSLNVASSRRPSSGSPPRLSHNHTLCPPATPWYVYPAIRGQVPNSPLPISPSDQDPSHKPRPSSVTCRSSLLHTSRSSLVIDRSTICPCTTSCQDMWLAHPHDFCFRAEMTSKSARVVSPKISHHRRPYPGNLVLVPCEAAQPSQMLPDEFGRLGPFEVSHIRPCHI